MRWVVRYRRAILILGLLAGAAFTVAQRTVWHGSYLVDLALLPAGLGCAILAVVANGRRPAAFLVVAGRPAYHLDHPAARSAIGTGAGYRDLLDSLEEPVLRSDAVRKVS